MKAMYNPLAFGRFFLSWKRCWKQDGLLWKGIFFFQITAPTGPPRVKKLTTALEEGLLLAQGRPVGQRTTSNEP